MERKRIGTIYLISILIFSLVIPLAIGMGANRMEIHRLKRLESEIQSMARLITARQTYRDVIYSEKSKILTDKRLLFSVAFTLDAGVDLEHCRIAWDRKQGKILYLPPVEIFSVDCDETSIKQYFAKEQFTSIRFSDYSLILEKEKEQLLREARQSDLIARARYNSVILLEEILSSRGGEDIHIRFAPPVGDLIFTEEGIDG
ncbi:MAG: DUF4230 domain-containing protein [Spirochaetales bacterium]|nr:DUF4230 domain-containing protein [Spirochaetales bacterium]